MTPQNSNEIDKDFSQALQDEDEVLRFIYEDCTDKDFFYDKPISESNDIIEEINNDGDEKVVQENEEDKERIVIDENSVKDYWNSETESAIVDFLYLNEFFYENRIKEEEENAEKEKRIVNKFYCNEMKRKMNEVNQISDRYEKREKIFREKIEPPLRKLIENILFRYKLFIPGIDTKTQQNDCFTFIYLKFINFNPWQKTKSYSFFGTIAKHYFLGNRKEFTKSLKVLHDYDSNKEEVERKKLEDPKTTLNIKESITFDLFNFVTKKLENELDKNSLSKNDQKVGDAIIQIFKNHENIGVYHKNQVYHLIKESSGLETKDITYSLHRFRVAYKSYKQDFLKKRDE